MAFERRRRRGGRDEGPSDGLEENVIQIYRCSKVVKGGRRFSFAALVVVGDRKGRVGMGYGKANEVPNAVEKGIAEAKKSMVSINLKGQTIPHQVIGRAGASSVIMVPASDGTGVIAGKKLRPMLELAGIQNLLTKAYGSTSPKNLLKAAMAALKKLRTAEMVSALRGVDIR
ncbi:MAG: 30S ribosomal protein S5 [Phycisphaerae bacterium]|nr:30S ribosomal protein S5 [Phycisphaerae bacterium]